LTWIFARGHAVHIGLSGVIIGYLGFLVSITYFYPSAFSFSMSAIALLLGFHLILTIIPNNKKTSWEGHLFGLISGILVGYLFFFLKIKII
jgi:membrane associated rhomboid family serine protease